MIGGAFFENVYRAGKETISLKKSPSTAPLAFSTVVSRHDHHNIEIKTVFEVNTKQFKSELDVFIFIPKNFEAASLAKADLQNDIRSRMRLAVPVYHEQGYRAIERATDGLKTALQRFENARRNGEIVAEGNHPLHQELTAQTKELAAVFSETLKKCSADHRRQFFLAHSLMSQNDATVHSLADLHASIEHVGECVAQVRDHMSTILSEPVGVVTLLDEYLSQVYVRYLGTIRGEFDRMMSVPEKLDGLQYRQSRCALEDLLERLQSKEAAHQQKIMPDALTEDPAALERHVVRMSHLKKFFQSKMFVDVTKEPAAKKLSESTAFAGTFLAGLVAAFFQQLNRPELVDLAFQSIYVICFAVAAYVLRDRLKDWAKAMLSKKASQFVADCEQQIFAEDRRIGVIKEWFSFHKPKNLPEPVRDLRRLAHHTEVERDLPEDILHYRKVQDSYSLRAERGEDQQSSWAVQENVRINVERYLKHMDDSYKEMTLFDSQGRLTTIKSHRVYHFYLCAMSSYSEGSSSLTEKVLRMKDTEPARHGHHHLYRIVLDKQGVDRVEQLI